MMSRTTNADYPSINQQQYGIHYPLVNPPVAIQNIIMDMTVSMDYPEAVVPLRIAFLSATDIIIVDADEKVIFDSTRLTASAEAVPSYTSFSSYQQQLQYAWTHYDSPLTYHYDSRTWTNDYIIKTWQCATVQIQLIIRAEHETSTFEMPDVYLDVRAVYKYPAHVQSLNGVSNHNVCLQAGHNIDLTADNNQISIASIGGAGMGAYETDCNANTRGLKMLGGATASDDGSIAMEAEDGYSLVAQPHHILISNSDTPCCKCEDMYELGLYYNEMAILYHELGAKYKYLRDKHADNLHKLQDRIPQKESLFRAILQPLGCPYFQLTIELKVTLDGCWDGAYGVLYINDEGHGGILATEPDWKAERHGFIGTGDYSDDDIQWSATQEVNEFVAEEVTDAQGIVHTIMAKHVTTVPYAPLTGELPSRLPPPYINGFPFENNRFYSTGTHIPIHWNCKLEAGDVLRINALMKAPKLYTEMYHPEESEYGQNIRPTVDIPVGVYLPVIEAHVLASLPYNTEQFYYSKSGLYRCVGSLNGQPLCAHSGDHYIDSQVQTLDLGCGDTTRLITDTSEDRVASMVSRVKALQRGKECVCITDPLERCRCENSHSAACRELESLDAQGAYPPALPACDDDSADFVEW